MIDRFVSRYIESDCEAHLRAEANSTSFYSAVKSWMGLQWLFLAVGLPILMTSIFFASTRAEDAWILQNILPAFILFSFLLGISLVTGRSRVAELNAAIALGVLAIVPSVKYGFVYENPDAMGHYSTAVEIARTGSVAGTAFYSEVYAPMPLMHILEAATGLTVGLPIDAVMALTLFLEHFVIFLLIVESARRMFPGIERRVIVFFALITVPVLTFFAGTTYGLLPLAMLTYVFSTTIRWKANEVLLATTLMLLTVLSHLITTVYFLIALAVYGISLLIVRRFRTPISSANISIIPVFFAIFLLWLVSIGEGFVHLLTFRPSGARPLSPVTVPFFDIVLTVLYAYARFIFSGVVALVASSVVLIRHRTTGIFLFFCSLFGAALLMGVIIGTGIYIPSVYRFASYVSMIAPYFACFLISRGKGQPWLLNTRRVRVVKVVIVAVLVVSTVAVYPLTPLYPKYDGNPVLEDNSVNTIYCLSGVNFFGSFYPLDSSPPVITTGRIFADMYSLYPEFTNLRYSIISTSLDDVTSLSELRNQMVVFDVERSGTQNLQMRTVVLPLLSGGLRDTLSVVYSNGFFYVAMAR